MWRVRCPVNSDARGSADACCLTFIERCDGITDPARSANVLRYRPTDCTQRRQHKQQSEFERISDVLQFKFGAVRGHSRSWAMPQFDRAHRTSYSTLIELL